jgi:triosephosphate isomerase
VYVGLWGLALVAEVVVSPPFVFLQQAKGLLRLDFAVAAQNCWVRKGGAFTGEIRSSGPSFNSLSPKLAQIL